MRKIYLTVLTVLALGIFLGFSNSDNPYGSRTPAGSDKVVVNQNDNNNPISTNGNIYYSDNFDAPNDTAALIARGYSVYRNGTFTGTPLSSFWFTGNPNVFPAFNGDPDDYAGSNYQTAGDLGDIDNWLVLPDLDVVAGDSIQFYSRAPTGSTFPDSIRVMYNPTNNTLPSDPNWIELGRFKVSTSGWELQGFEAPTTNFSARFAIRYSVVNGGLNGANSDYIGIDALVVIGDGVLPVELSSFVSVINNNNVTLNWSTASEINNSGFDIERSSVSGSWTKIANVSGNGTSTTPNSYSYTDRNVASGNYNYRLKQIDFNGNFEYFNLSNEVVIGVPTEFKLSQNFPNPFNPSTTISYEIPVDGAVSLKIFDMSGKEVMNLVDGVKNAGYYSINFNASNLSSGIYFYKLSANDFTSVMKMMLVK
ncbi:MAG: T9SS type A sorting domain-containing protein [Ignavibacteria bacterium]|nr:T9SS type A sorting domain-containing protein [Ignavibacteria bacterium]